MTFLFQTNKIRVILKNVLALESFIRAKQNTGHKLEVQKKDLQRKMLEDFDISQEETGFPLLETKLGSSETYSYPSLRYAYVIHWNTTVSCAHIQQLVKARDYSFYISFTYGFYSCTNASIHFWRPLLTPRSHLEYFWWWIYALYFAKIKNLTTAIKIKFGRARTFFILTLIVFIWKKKVIYT